MKFDTSPQAHQHTPLPKNNKKKQPSIKWRKAIDLKYTENCVCFQNLSIVFYAKTGVYQLPTSACSPPGWPICIAHSAGHRHYPLLSNLSDNCFFQQSQPIEMGVLTVGWYPWQVWYTRINSLSLSFWTLSIIFYVKTGACQLPSSVHCLAEQCVFILLQTQG